MKKKSEYIILIIFILFSFYQNRIYSKTNLDSLEITIDTATIDSLESIIDTTTIDSQKISRINDLSYILLSQDLTQTERYNKIALKLLKNIDSKELSADTYYLTGIIHKSLGNYDSVMTYLSKALNIYEEMGNEIKQSQCLRNIGDLQRGMGEFDIACHYINKSLDIARKINDETLISSSLNRLSAVYFEMKLYLEAIDYAEKSIEISEKLGNIGISSNNYVILGATYNRLDENENALKYLNKALEIDKSINNISDIPNTLNNIASLYSKTGQYDKVIEYASQSLEMSQKSKIKIYISISAFLLAQAYKEKNDFENAYKYLDMYQRYQFSIYTEKKSKQISDLQEKYDADNREHINEQLSKENKYVEAIVLRQRIIGAVVILLLIVISLFARTLFKKKKKIEIAQALLSEKNEEIHKQKDEIEFQNEKLIELNNTKDKFFSLVSHDLRSPFSSLLGLSDLLYEQFNEFPDEEKMKFIKAMRDSIHNIYQFINSLLEWAQIQMGKIPVNRINFELFPSIHTIYSLLEIQAKNKNIELVNSIKKDIVVFSDFQMTETIIRNLVSNAIKFTNKGGRVEIMAEKKEDFVEISIKDTGIGLSEKAIKKLFIINENYKMPGTEDEIGTGLGLVLCKEFINKNNGDIWVESEFGKGSTFKFTLPAGEL